MPESKTKGPAEAENAPAFSFERYIVRKVVFEQIQRTQPDKDEKRPAVINTTMNMRIGIDANDQTKKGHVTIAVVVNTDLKWQPYRLEVVVSGIFGYMNTDAATFARFCKGSAPSILFPYIRQIAHNTSADGAYGPVRINPINVQNLIATDWPTAKAIGAPTEISDSPDESEPTH